MVNEKLEQELKHLFGEQVAENSKTINMTQIINEIESIPNSVAMLTRCQGQPQAQKVIIKEMNEQAAKALCQWIRIA